MSDPPTTFTVSTDFLTRRQRLMAVLSGAILVLSPFVLLAVVDFDVRKAVSLLPFGLIAVVVVGVGTVVLMRALLGSWRRMHLHLGPDGLRHEAGAVQRIVPWDTITKVRIHHTPRGEPQAVEVFTAQRRPFVLVGFGPMPDIVALIQHHVPSTVPVDTTRQRVAWEHPLVVILMIMGALVVFEAVRRVGGPMVFDTINYAILLVGGCGGSPMTPSRARTHTSESGKASVESS
jgi:hypothetical protein